MRTSASILHFRKLPKYSFQQREFRARCGDLKITLHAFGQSKLCVNDVAPVISLITPTAYFTGVSKIVGGYAGVAMAAVVTNPGNRLSVAVLDKNPNWHGMLIGL